MAKARKLKIAGEEEIVALANPSGILLSELKDNITPGFKDKANIVITPANDIYDGQIADRPDAFNSLTWDYGASLDNVDSQYSYWSAYVQDTDKFNKNSIQIAASDSKYSNNVSLYLYDSSASLDFWPLDRGAFNPGPYTDSNGVIWTATHDATARTVTITPSKTQWIDQKLFDIDNEGKNISLSLISEQRFDLADAIYEIRNSVNPRIGSLETNKADKVVTPANDEYDGQIADRPDAYNYIKWNYADVISYSTASMNNTEWVIKTSSTQDFTDANNINLSFNSEPGGAIAYILDKGVFTQFFTNGILTISNYTDSNGTTWTFDDSVADTIKVSADVVQWIEQKINNKNDAGRYVKLFLSAMQTFNLSDVLYEVRNSVNPRIAALESKKDIVVPREVPKAPDVINFKKGELVEVMDGPDSVLAMVLQDGVSGNLDTDFTDQQIIALNQRVDYDQYATKIRNWGDVNIAVTPHIADINDIFLTAPVMDPTSTSYSKITFDLNKKVIGTLFIERDLVSILDESGAPLKVLWDGTNWETNSEVIDLGNGVEAKYIPLVSDTRGDAELMISERVTIYTSYLITNSSDKMTAIANGMFVTDFSDVSILSYDTSDDIAGINLATKQWKVIPPIDDTKFVKISGYAKILDIKEFVSGIIVPDRKALDNSSNAANTKYVDTAIANKVTNQQYWLPAVANSGLIYNTGDAISGAIGHYSSGDTYIVHTVSEGDDWQLVARADPTLGIAPSGWVLFNDRDTYLSSSTEFAKVNGNPVKGTSGDILVQPQITSGIANQLMTPPLTTGGQPGVISISGIVAWGDYIS